MKKLLRFIPLTLLLAFAAPAQAQTAVPYTNAALTNTAILVRAGQTTLQLYNFSNPTSGTVFIQFFNAATAGAVTVGTTAPYWVIAVPPFGVNDTPLTAPLTFPLGMVVAVTTTYAGATAPATASTASILYQ